MDWNSVLPAVLSSAAIVAAIQLFGSRLNSRGEVLAVKRERDAKIADRYFNEISDRLAATEAQVQTLTDRLDNAESRANKWQLQYFQLQTDYKVLEAKFDHLSTQYAELKKAFENKENS